MAALDILTISIAGLSAVATAGIALATRRYARGTLDLANATLTGVRAQADAAQALSDVNREIAANSTRAQIVSSTRLAWMDSVRDAVAEFLSLDDQIKTGSAALLSQDAYQNLVQRRLGTRHRIEFRLDPDKQMHTVLLATVDDLLACPVHDVAMVQSIRRLTTTIMEAEWRRVRREVGAPVSADSPDDS